MNENLYCLLSTRFPGDRSQTVIETQDGDVYTYADLERESARFASLLSSLGLQPGERVAVQVDKSPQALFLYLGCIRAGLIYLPLNTAYEHEEVAYFLDDARPDVLVCRSAALSMMTTLAAERDIRHVMTLEEDGSGSAVERARSRDLDFSPVLRAGDDVAAILYTSGTTGRSKGAMITHRNLASNAVALHRLWGWRDGDVLLHALPVYHVHGLFVACHCALLNGSTLLWMQRFEASVATELLPRATVFMGVPTYYTRLLAEPGFERAACANMRLFISGSAPLREQTFQQFHERTGHTILERYGMTETGMNTSNPLHGARLAGTVGLPLPGVFIRVADDELRDVPRGTVGQLLVKGENVFRGYWGMPEKTAEEFTADGYFKTGDLASMDEHGYVSIVGRGKDLIISGGLNVYPKEIERRIDEIDGVKESAVIGLPHPDFGEAVAAVIVPQERYREALPLPIIETLRGSLASFKIPKKVFYLDQLPRNAMGKIQKNVLRERYRGETETY